jgi:nucleotide-binding universal stress UspA family protein
MFFPVFVIGLQDNGRFSMILVAIDGSAPSMKAAEFAIIMAEKEQSDQSEKGGSELIALTVIDVSKPRGFLSSFIAAPTYGLKELEQERNEAKRWMEELRKKAEVKKVPFRSEILEGVISVEGAIVNYVESHGVNLLVIGTRGRSGFSKVLLGSVASKVVTYATCPVLVVK